jgi:SAM-dependent methyltransferase
VRPEARAHYEEDASERDRLTQGHGVLEFLRTQELLARHLPVPPARILDVGGAAGIHALPLAQQGYEVDLIDPVELHVRQARDASAVAPAPLRSAEVGDARTLAAPDGAFDAVLELGPLPHITDRGDRLTALRDALRVLRPGGLLAAAVISRVASTADGLRYGLLDEPGFEDIVERDLRDGAHVVPEHRPELFTPRTSTGPTRPAPRCSRRASRTSPPSRSRAWRRGSPTSRPGWPTPPAASGCSPRSAGWRRCPRCWRHHRTC